jgi:DNA-binding CsgD family transcriptional regulator
MPAIESSQIPGGGGSPLDRLSDRQSQCLALVAEGFSSAAIGDRLGLSPRTVDEHLTGVCRLLGVRTRIQAVARLAASQRRSERRSFLP